MKERMTAEEYRREIANNAALLVSDMVNKDKIDDKSYRLSSSEKKIDSTTKERPAKYRNSKCEYNGMKFDSAGELRRWKELELMQKAGRIQALQRQVRFTVFEGSTYQLSIHWIPDFLYRLEGPVQKMVVEDFKSPLTAKKPDFRIKVKLFKKMYSNYLVYISTDKGIREWK